ncbi:MAG: class B sortase [Oscillospiraceae bacterium]|jgi:sortase B|nr:class B sortase [Oscillospiraceae bacterium]
MALSGGAKKAYKKAVKAKKKKIRGHWLLIQKGDGAREVASKLFTQLAVLVLIGCIAILGNELRLSLSAKFLNSSLKDLYYTYISPGDNGGEILDSAKELLAINPDTVGWVHIDNTNISMPVVHRSGSDGNEYYLKVAFDGSSNKAGTIFMDSRNVMDAHNRSDNIVLYGHNQRDKTMFGDLGYYKKDLQYYSEHPVIQFSSNYRTDTYKIFAFFVTPVLESQTSDGVVFDYHNYLDFKSEADYNAFMDNIMLRTQIITPVDVEYGDKFLTLSTCSNEFEPSRFVVFARRVREDEDPSVDVSQAYLNAGAKEPEWNVIYGR